MNLINTDLFFSPTDAFGKRTQALLNNRLNLKACGIIQPKHPSNTLTYRYEQPFCGFT